MRLDTTITLWNDAVEDTLRRLENARRREQNIPLLNDKEVIYIPGGPKASLQILNLKVWCNRYCVSLSFILETLLENFKYLRKHDNYVCLGVGATTISGGLAKRKLKEAIIKTFPNGENYRTANQPMPSLPLLTLEYETTREFLERYRKIMSSRQRETFKQPKYHRNFRRPGRIL